MGLMVDPELAKGDPQARATPQINENSYVSLIQVSTHRGVAESCGKTLKLTDGIKVII